MTSEGNNTKSMDHCNKCHVKNTSPLVKCAACDYPFHMKCVAPKVTVKSFDEVLATPNFHFYCDDHMNLSVHKLLKRLTSMEAKFKECFSACSSINNDLAQFQYDLANFKFEKCAGENPHQSRKMENHHHEEQNQFHFFQLPEEIIEIIASYLDLIDLKNLSQSCQYLNEVCGKRLGKHFKISFSGVLSLRDFRTFENSIRKYENVGVHECGDLKEFECILKQVESLPSIEMKCIHITGEYTCSIDRLMKIVELLKRDAPNVKEIVTRINIDNKISTEDYNHISTISKTYTLSPELVILSPINFSKINMDFNYPTKINVYEKIHVDHVIENVKEISLDIPADIRDFRCFTKLEKLNVYWGVNLDLMRAVITNNKETLKHLRLNSEQSIFSNFVENFELPCQLKTVECMTLIHSSIPTTFLVSQRSLRSVTLGFIKLTNNLLDTLSKQKMLSQISLDRCSFDVSLDLEKFEFLKNVLELKLTIFSNDALLMKVILKYADKVEKLSFEYDPNELDDNVDDNNTKKLLSNLKHLNIDSQAASDFLRSRFEYPNLEKCSIDCNPDLLYNCKRLKNLIIREDKQMNPKDVQSLLKNLPSLEVLDVWINHEDLEAILQNILRNMNNVLHFRFKLHGWERLTKNIWGFKNMVADTLNNLEIIYSERTFSESRFTRLVYNTDSYSFEIALL